MNQNIIETRLNMAVRKKYITRKEQRILLKKIKNLESAIAYRKLRSDSDDFDEQFVDVCKSVLLMSKYTFQQALSDYNVESPESFFDNVWNSLVTIENNFSVSVCDLYTLCNDMDYLNSEASASAYDFILGKFSDDDLAILKQVALKHGMCQSVTKLEKKQFQSELKQSKASFCEEKKQTSVSECGDIQTSAILDAIISADELRSSFIEIDPVAADAEDLLSKVYKTLNVSVFKGVLTCSVKTREYTEKEREKIASIFAEKEFDVVWESDKHETVMVVIAKQYNGDYSTVYSEEELQCMLESGLGSVYSFVAVYSQNVLEPRILSRITSEIVQALKKVTFEEKGLTFPRVKTKTRVYEILFTSLRAKGFTVLERKGCFEMRWDND